MHSLGSVITLTGIDPPLTGEERNRLAAGVGLYREQGLGRVCLDPALLAKDRPTFVPALPRATDDPKATRPDHPLIAWLEQRAGKGASRRAAETWAKGLAQELEHRYGLARRYAGVPDDLPIGPSPAQWGRVYEQARGARKLADLRDALFEGGKAVCKERGEGWQEMFRDEAGVRSFRDWFKQAAEAKDAGIHALRLFGREAQRIAQQQHGRGDRGEASA